MKIEEVSVATITLARSEKEEKLIIDGLKVLSTLGFPVIVAVDGGSTDNFIQKTFQIPHIQIAQATIKGILPQVRQSLRKSSSFSPFVFYTESDKFDFFKSSLLPFFEKVRTLPDQEEHVGMFVPARTQSSFAHYTPFQQKTEQRVNRELSSIIGLDTIYDFTYGPRLLSTSLIPYLEYVPEDIGWGWMTYLLVVAHRIGKKILPIPLDLPAPVEQQDFQRNRQYRTQQMNQHFQAMQLAQSIHIPINQ
jgi:hypothetical protein